MGLWKTRLNDRPLSVQFLVAGGVVAFFSTLSLVFLLVQVYRQAEASRWLAGTHRAIAQFNTFGSDLIKERAALQEYIRGPAHATLAGILDAHKLAEDGLMALRGITALIPGERELIDQLEHNYSRLWDMVSQRIPAQGSVSVKAVGTFDEQNIDALFKQALVLVDQVINGRTRALVDIERQERSAVDSTLIRIAALNIALWLVFGVVLTKLYFSIARPISELSRGMERYRKGDFAARVSVSNLSQIGFLEASFNEMAEKIEAMVVDLRKLDKLKSEFISTVSHELRTPLTAIGGYVKLLAAGDAGPVTETQREFLYIIDTNVVRLTHLINDILDVEKMESGKVQLVREPQDLISILKECRDTFHIIAEQKGLELRFSVPDRLNFVMGDRSKLVQVFMNLLSNATKYTETGFVEIEALERDFAVVVRVRDSGVGLTSEEQESVFQKFYRARSGLASLEGGTGLGLPIVRGLVEAHGGHVTVDSVVGSGTTFSVTLPVAPVLIRLEDAEESFAPDEHRDGVRIRAVPERRKEKEWVRQVWIVDGNDADVSSMTRLLEDGGQLFRGHSLKVSAFSSIDAIPSDIPPSELPVLVIIDPSSVSDHSSAVTSLRRKFHRTMPVLVIGSSIDTASALTDGASAVLSKPIVERDFLAAVRDAMATKGWRVLVADRNTDLRILIKHSLEQRGFKVDDVDRGGLLLGRIEKEEYDLALIGTSFLDVSGMELLKVIRRNKRSSSLPVVVMLDEEDTHNAKEEFEAWGADHFVGKYRGIGGIVDSVVQYLEDKKLLEQSN